MTGDDECTLNVIQDSNAATVRYKSLIFGIQGLKKIFKRNPFRSKKDFLLNFRWLIGPITVLFIELIDFFKRSSFSQKSKGVTFEDLFPLTVKW